MRSTTGSKVIDVGALDEIADRVLAVRSGDHPVAMLLVSIDYFDVVTASHGADVARELLAIVAGRLDEVLRPDDPRCCQDDGFLVMWDPAAGGPSAGDIAARIASRFEQPAMTSIGQLPMTVSIGIAAADHDDCAPTSARAMRRQARSAVLSAQRAGRSQTATFDCSIRSQALESYRTEGRLRTALNEGRLEVAYQPIVSLQTGRIVGVEALARWDDRRLGRVSPSAFIPIAEESGLIGEMGRRILANAISQGAIWNDGDADEVLITVNLSNRQLLDPDLLPTIDELVARASLNPRLLCLEMSESVVMSDVAASMTILGHLKDRGLRLAIDDFGTGYSSLSYLRRLPVDTLKIDQSFVQSIYNRDDRMITKAIIDLAHTLGMTTVAEGVETRLQIEVLHALDCDMAQGFYLQTPTSPDRLDFSPIDFEYPNTSDTAPGLASRLSDADARRYATTAVFS